MRIKLAIPLNYSVLQPITNVFCAKNDFKIEFICTDSRLVEEGDLFIPLASNVSDFKSHSIDALKRGGYVLAESDNSIISQDSSKKILLQIASLYKKRLPNLKYTVAITGSLGKTTTKELTRIILSKKYKRFLLRNLWN